MNLVLPQPVPAAIDGGTIVGLIFIVISFLGWIINLLNQKQQQQAGPARPRRRPMNESERQLRSELDAFLEEAGNRRGRPQAARRPRQPQPARREEPIELVFDPEPPPAEKRVEPAVGTLSQRHLESSVTSHVAEYMESHIGGDVDKRQIREDVRDIVREHLDDLPVEGATPAPTTGDVRQLLRNPAGVRQAILLNEILSPCKGSRRE